MKNAECKIQNAELRNFSQIAHMLTHLQAVEKCGGGESDNVAYDKSRRTHSELEGYEIAYGDVDYDVGNKGYDGDALNLLKTT